MAEMVGFRNQAKNMGYLSALKGGMDPKAGDFGSSQTLTHRSGGTWNWTGPPGWGPARESRPWQPGMGWNKLGKKCGLPVFGQDRHSIGHLYILFVNELCSFFVHIIVSHKSDLNSAEMVRIPQRHRHYKTRPPLDVIGLLRPRPAGGAAPRGHPERSPPRHGARAAATPLAGWCVTFAPPSSIFITQGF